MSNPYATAEEEGKVWTTSTGQWLSDGDFVVTITEAIGGTSQSFKPIIDFRFENEQGHQKDRMPYSGDFPDKLVAIAKATGVALPTEDDVDPSDNYRVSDRYIAKFVGKQLGIVVRLGKPNKDNKQFQEVKGYVTPDEIKSGTVSAQPVEQPAASSGSSRDEDIPF